MEKIYFIGKRKDFNRILLRFDNIKDVLIFGEEFPVKFEEEMMKQMKDLAPYYFKKYNNNKVMILLSSLEIPALNYFPYLAYDLVIDRLSVSRFTDLIGKGSRDAIYKAAIIFISNSDYFELEYQVKGKITRVPSEESIEGIFIPEGYKKTIAELDNKIEISPIYKLFKTLVDRIHTGKKKKKKEYIEIGEEVIVETVLDRYDMKKVTKKIKVLMDPETGVIMKIPVDVESE